MKPRIHNLSPGPASADVWSSPVSNYQVPIRSTNPEDHRMPLE